MFVHEPALRDPGPVPRGGHVPATPQLQYQRGHGPAPGLHCGPRARAQVPACPTAPSQPRGTRQPGQWASKCQGREPWPFSVPSRPHPQPGDPPGAWGWGWPRAGPVSSGLGRAKCHHSTLAVPPPCSQCLHLSLGSHHTLVPKCSVALGKSPALSGPVCSLWMEGLESMMARLLRLCVCTRLMSKRGPCPQPRAGQLRWRTWQQLTQSGGRGAGSQSPVGQAVRAVCRSDALYPW